MSDFELDDVILFQLLRRDVLLFRPKRSCREEGFLIAAWDPRRDARKSVPESNTRLDAHVARNSPYSNGRSTKDRASAFPSGSIMGFKLDRSSVVFSWNSRNP